MADLDDARAQILAAHAALVAGGTLAPLGPGEAETRLWLDCEIASLAENRFFAAVDPLAMTPEIRALWEPRATSDEPLSSPHGQAFYRAAYWILDGGARAGTVALSTAPSGSGTITVSSLYVRTSFRRRGIAARTLRGAHAASRGAGGPGLRVPAYWTWQPAVRFYLTLGLWISGWRDSLVFVTRDDLPIFRVEAGGDEARFSVRSSEGFEPLISAVRRGDRLGWTELAAVSRLVGEGSPLAGFARQTFAVALAVRGFPLVRSPEAWAARLASADGGEPEGLAYKIELFEGWDRKSGFEVRTPRIPGLTYPAWDVISDASSSPPA
jgi:GNAT superfamily N-acetyltransferase